MKKSLWWAGGMLAVLVFAFFLWSCDQTVQDRRVGHYTFHDQGLAFDTATGEMWRLAPVPGSSNVFWVKFGSRVKASPEEALEDAFSGIEEAPEVKE